VRLILRILFLYISPVIFIAQTLATMPHFSALQWVEMILVLISVVLQIMLFVFSIRVYRVKRKRPFCLLMCACACYVIPPVIGTQIDPAVSGGRSGHACRTRGDVTAKVSDCTQSRCGNVVPPPDPLVSTALADWLDSCAGRSHGIAAFTRDARSFDATQPALPRDRRRQDAAQSILHSTFIPAPG
jgi:hypothetical protein